jgi:hypothetical protein
MLKINTERLSILPLDKQNLVLAIENYNEMEKSLGLTITDKNIGMSIYKEDEECFWWRLKELV